MANDKTELDPTERIATRFQGVYYRLSASRMFRSKPDMCFVIDYCDPVTGKRTRKTIGWRSEGFTAEVAASMRHDLLSSGKKQAVMGDLFIPATQNMLFAEAWELYKRDWLIGRQKKTLQTDSILFEKHLREIATVPLSKLNAHDLDRLMGQLARTGLAPQTIWHVIGLVRRVMRKMEQWKLWSGNLPFRDLTKPAINNQRTRYLTPEEAQQLLEALRVKSETMWCMALISLQCGLRWGEIAALTFGDVDCQSQTICIRESKSGKSRHVLMTTMVSQAIQSTFTYTSAKYALLFPARNGGIRRAPSDSFERTVAELGLNDGVRDRRDKVVFHTLRHTYASWLALAGQGQSVISDLLGHATLEMSKRYIHLMPSSHRAAAQAIESLFTTHTEHDESPTHQKS